MFGSVCFVSTCSRKHFTENKTINSHFLCSHKAGICNKPNEEIDSCFTDNYIFCYGKLHLTAILKKTTTRKRSNKSICVSIKKRIMGYSIVNVKIPLPGMFGTVFN